MTSLYLKEINIAFLSIGLMVFLIIVNLCPQPWVHFFIFMGYFIDPVLSRCAFFIYLQVLLYFIIYFSFERRRETKSIFCYAYIFLLLCQTAWGFSYFGEFYWNDPVKLALLLSETCILFICLKRQSYWKYTSSLALTIFVGIILTPKPGITLCGIPFGIFLLIFVQFYSLMGLVIFKKELTHSLIPFFSSAILVLLRSFPEISSSYLGVWIEGLDFIVFLLGVLSCFDERKKES